MSTTLQEKSKRGGTPAADTASSFESTIRGTRMIGVGPDHNAEGKRTHIPKKVVDTHLSGFYKQPDPLEDVTTFIAEYTDENVRLVNEAIKMVAQLAAESPETKVNLGSVFAEALKADRRDVAEAELQKGQAQTAARIKALEAKYGVTV